MQGNSMRTHTHPHTICKNAVLADQQDGCQLRIWFEFTKINTHTHIYVYYIYILWNIYIYIHIHIYTTMRDQADHLQMMQAFFRPLKLTTDPRLGWRSAGDSDIHDPIALAILAPRMEYHGRSIPTWLGHVWVNVGKCSEIYAIHGAYGRSEDVVSSHIPFRKWTPCTSLRLCALWCSEMTMDNAVILGS